MKKLIVSIGLIVLLFFYQMYTSKTDLDSFARVNVLHEGRVKPLDTVARKTLVLLRGNSLIGKPAIEWFADLLMDGKKNAQFPSFRIDHPDLVTLINQGEKRYFSYLELEKHIDQIAKQAEAFSEQKELDAYQKELLNLWQKMLLYGGMSHTLFINTAEDPIKEIQVFKEGIFAAEKSEQEWSHADKKLLQWFYERYQFMHSASQFSLIQHSEKEWLTTAEAIFTILDKESQNRSILENQLYQYLNIRKAYLQKDQKKFNQLLSVITPKFSYEYLFNRLSPFYLSSLLYLLTAIFFLIFYQKKFISFVSSLFFAAFFYHTLGLVSRMWIEGRPPVTNLYSSALFVGWGVCFFALCIHLFSKESLYLFISSLIGSSSLVVAHYLSLTGDTMEATRAVLNSNFWLSTHVVTITLGYSSAFFAGFFALVVVCFAFFDPRIVKKYSTIIYLIICLSTFLSFVGTVLGGIWADQSWGRFWGWDPKENGALLIVIWNAIILHARFGGLIAYRGLLQMAIFGNIVTSFSWFGVNMLGVGLHSYGFMDEAFFPLFCFVIFNLLFILVAYFMPSYQKKAL